MQTLAVDVTPMPSTALLIAPIPVKLKFQVEDVFVLGHADPKAICRVQDAPLASVRPKQLSLVVETPPARTVPLVLTRFSVIALTEVGPALVTVTTPLV